MRSRDEPTELTYIDLAPRFMEHLNRECGTYHEPGRYLRLDDLRTLARNTRDEDLSDLLLDVCDWVDQAGTGIVVDKKMSSLADASKT